MRLFRFWQRKGHDLDLAQEIESYLAHEEDLQAVKGLAAEEAGWAARRKLGNRTAVKETVWKMDSLSLSKASGKTSAMRRGCCG